MTKVDVYKTSGEKHSQIELAQEIFSVVSKPSLMHQSVTAYLSNQRQSNAHAKTRSEVSGGGKKPWKQKGTGNARSGSSRSPIWIGGGVTFGPRNSRNWTKAFPKKMSRRSIFTALTNSAKDKKTIILDKLDFSQIKTKLAEKLFSDLPIEKGTILVILAKPNKNVEMSMRNLSYVKVLHANSLNVYDILKYDWIVAPVDAIKEIEKIFLHKSDSKDDAQKDTKAVKDDVKKSGNAKKTVKSAAKSASESKAGK